MVIVLTKDEKRTFYGFLGLYLGSSLLLFIIIGWLFYVLQAKQYQALTVSKMQINSTNMSHIIIQTHMRKKDLRKEDIHILKGFKYGLYDINKKPIYSQLDDKIDFSKKYYKKDKDSFYISRGALEHFDISYIVIKESSLNQEIDTLLNEIIISVVALYIIIALIGFYLAKLFIYPIQSQRKKLNNFIKDTTHELNTPISALLLCVESDNYYTEQNRNHIKMSSKKISNLYKDLTYLFLKDHNKKQNFNNKISDILQNELEFQIQLAKKKNIAITSDIEETFYKIDEEDFIRIVNNIISNSIKYTKRNGNIKISLKNNILTVQDTGIGIKKENLNKIFKRYYRDTDTVGGFGIGLNIVYSICNTYNVKIDIQSEVKKGTAFTLDFN